MGATDVAGVLVQDGPTREALMGRAAALGEYRVGTPLPFEDLRFARNNSAVAWSARGSPESPAATRAAIAEVEAFCADTGCPQTRFDAGGLAAAELLRRVSHGDVTEVGLMLAQAVPPVSPSGPLVPGPDLTGRVATYRWPAGGPPEALLGPSGPRPKPGADTSRPRTCSAVGETAEHRWCAGWQAGQVLQRRLPDCGASRTAPDSTGHRRSLTRSLHDQPANERTAEPAANLRSSRADSAAVWSVSSPLAGPVCDSAPAPPRWLSGDQGSRLVLWAAAAAVGRR